MLDLRPQPHTPESQDSGRAEPGPVAGVNANVPDLLLIERARARDTRAWEAIMQRYNQRLFRIARSILPSVQAAVDLVADSYLRAFADLEHYEPAGKLGPWLARIAFTQAVSSRRSAALSRVATAVATASVAPVVEEVADEPAEPVVSEEARTLERTIDALPEVFRTVFVLRVIEGISGIETAACLGINETTVRTRLYRAHRRLPAGLPERITAERSTLFELNHAQSAQLISRVFARLGT